MNPTFYSPRQVLEALEEERTEVGRLRRSAASLRSRCTSTTASYTPRTGNGNPDQRDGRLIALDEEQRILALHQKHLVSLEEYLDHWIGRLPKSRWRMVLRYHYLEGLNLQDTCEQLSRDAGLSFSMSQIYHLHHAALKSAADSLEV